MHKGSFAVVVEDGPERTEGQRARMVSASMLAEKDVLGMKEKLVVIGLRGSNQIPQIDRTPSLPVLYSEYVLSSYRYTWTKLTRKGTRGLAAHRTGRGERSGSLMSRNWRRQPSGSVQSAARDNRWSALYMDFEDWS
jgi:hypothetical protein